MGVCVFRCLSLEEVAECAIAILPLCHLHHLGNGVVLLDFTAKAFYKHLCSCYASTRDGSVALYRLCKGQASVESHTLVLVGIPIFNLIDKVGFGLLDGISVCVSALAIGHKVLLFG